ncbi:DUF721 domain-containing protein [Desulfonatronospira sp.]|uniref:DUF721 domain-containing protein n=1 Tax=Desulfonatronospira sp. TaxID=1962951 RepID=UPI0025BC3A18|nr:DUF721 domain-containing protein [Desulfonatronospira sp.]
MLDNFFKRNDPEGRHYLFVKICENWRRIVGAELADLASPVGRKKRTLILGAQDSIVIQEVTFQQEELLRRVNDFCGVVLFDNLRIELLKGRTPLDAPLVQNTGTGLEPRRPKQLGGLLDAFPKGSAIARCYAKYVDFFNKNT